MAYTEAKQSVIPFNKKGEHNMKPGELTHIDVWGQYDVASINNFQYYLLLVDDASRYVTVEFLKSKDQVAQKVKNYLTHLEVQGKMPKAICVDCGCEFVNKVLLQWCYAKGMEVHMTAPHSPSQNGVTKQMNCMLKDLARAMHFAADLPVFLWEQAVVHMAYVRNYVYSSAVREATPYERWHGTKPDVLHLREFGVPVWILLQGQKVLPKMELCSRCSTLVGYDDGSKSVLYYNAETHKVLTSRNFHFLEPSDTPADLECIIITANNVAHEGESMGDTPNTVDAQNVDGEPRPLSLQKRK